MHSINLYTFIKGLWEVNILLKRLYIFNLISYINMKQFLLRIYEYNIWRHTTVYNQISKVNNFYSRLEVDDKGLYFKSIKGTFNHLLLADVLWLTRINKITQFQLPHNDVKIEIENLNSLWGESTTQGFIIFFESTSDWFSNHKTSQLYIFSEYKNLLEMLDENDF